MDKFDAVLDNKLVKEQNIDNTDFTIVKNGLSNYLGFNVDELLEDTDAVIFGGAPRDCIANLEIHDIDIMALPKSTKEIIRHF